MVYFVGAGPGAPDLITVRGKTLLGKADCIIYAGSLVNEELLDYKKPECQVHNSAYLTLEEVIEIIADNDGKGLSTVRLHTGDPSLYGAVREQMDRLDELGISYQSCPGVSSFFGAAAVMNMEYTLPGVSQSVIITRMAGRTPVPEKENIASFAAHGATMVIFLSTGMLPALSAALIEGGYQETTPAAIVYKATWEDEQVIICKVSELAEKAEAAGIKKTALIVVGEAVTHQHYMRSELYHPLFSTEFRSSKNE